MRRLLQRAELAISLRHADQRVGAVTNLRRSLQPVDQRVALAISRRRSPRHVDQPAGPVTDKLSAG